MKAPSPTDGAAAPLMPGSRRECVDFWAMTTNTSSSAAHAYKGGKAICGSPLKASRQRWETPGCIGCKKCLKIWKALREEGPEND